MGRSANPETGLKVNPVNVAVGQQTVEVDQQKAEDAPQITKEDIQAVQKDQCISGVFVSKMNTFEDFFEYSNEKLCTDWYSALNSKDWPRLLSH